MSRLMNDRRKHERIALRLAVQLDGAEASVAAGCFTRNISSGGLYFLSPAPLIRGEQVDVFLVLPVCREIHSCTNAGIRCQIRVVRIDSLGNGLGFGIACQIESYTVAASERTDVAWRIYV